VHIFNRIILVEVQVLAEDTESYKHLFWILVEIHT
jgi:hypothetical protein